MSKEVESLVTFEECGKVKICSGMPQIENVLGFEPGSFRGTMYVEQNADATFVPDAPRAITPPSMDDVLKDQNLIVKRTSRNFIVTMKFPIIESAETTTQSQKEMWKKSQKAIATAREAIKQTF